ncbi:MAG: protein phosphatase 2C domain-containing protein [Nitrospirota bacterium]
MNEDAVLVDEDAGLYLLADGMSGPRAGRVASRLAVRKAHAFLKERSAHTPDAGILPLLTRALEHAHGVVQKASLKRGALSGMGTTLIVLCIRGETAYLSHVGDSRAYLIRQGTLSRITTDHTTDYGIEQDVMLRELFFYHKARVLSQALGPSKKVVCDSHSIDLLPGDRILLCSDGLTDMLSDGAIEEMLKVHGDDIEKTSDLLVEAANRMGGKDNISLVLFGR